MSSKLQSELNDTREPNFTLGDKGAPTGAKLDELVEFVQRKRRANLKKEEAAKKLHAAGLKAYQKMKSSA